MSCGNKKFKTAEASSKARLRTKGIIDKFLNILNYNEFNRLNDKWSDDAKARFGTTGNLFYTNLPGTKAIANKKAFKQIDESKGIYYSPEVNREEIITSLSDGKGNQFQKPQERLNQVQEVFNENPELANAVYEALGSSQESNLSTGTSGSAKEVVQDLSGNTYSANESDITTYETEFGSIRYITNESGDMVMLSDKNTDTVENQITQQNRKTTISSPASPAVVKLMKDFMQRAGIDYTQVSKIIANGKEVNANGVANLFQGLIQVVRGKEATALPEEAMHFAVELIQKNDPKLFQQLLKEINSYSVLQEVYKEYGEHPLYQTKEGKPDILKLKKEAIAKVLVEVIIDKYDGKTQTIDLLKRAESWWDKIINFIKGLIGKSGFDTAAMKILAGEEIGSVKDLRESEHDLFLQMDAQTKIYNELKERSAKVQLKDDPSSTEGKQAYFLGDKKFKYRVSDFIHDWYSSRFANKAISIDEFDAAVNDLKAEKGTDGHKDLEHAFSIFVNEDGYLKSFDERLVAKSMDSDYKSKLNPHDNDMYIMLRDNLEARLVSYREGTRFLSEFIVYDEKSDTAGTVDFAAIDVNGNVNLLDWKFMDLNTYRYNDVPWYKITAWNKQMSQYKRILTSSYSIKSEQFRHTRMIPIKAHYTRPNKQKNILPYLTNIEIGDVDVQNVQEEYLLPVGIEEETTGIKAVDRLLKKLNKTYKKLAEGKALPSEKENKNEQLNALFSAIRQLQIKQNIVPLIHQAKILNKQIHNLREKHNLVFYKDDAGNFKLAEDKYKDAGMYTESDISEMTKEIETAKEALKNYINLEHELAFIFEGKELTKEDKKLRKDLRKTVYNARKGLDELEILDTEFTDNIIGKSEKIKNLSAPEKIIKGIGKWFGTTATLQMKSLQVLYKKANRAFGWAAQETRDELIELKRLKDDYMLWAAGKGLSKGNMFNILKKENKNELIDEFDVNFYKTFDEKAKELNYKWIQENIDTEKYKEFLEKKLEDELLRIENKNRAGSKKEIERDIEREKRKAREEMDTSAINSFGWLRTDAKKFPNREKWESTEWKTLNKPENAPALAFYKYILSRNDYFQSIGYINAREARVFLPWVRKGLAEKLIFGGNVTLGEQFLRNITIDESDIGYGQIDPHTGKPVDVVPVMLTKKIEGDYSTDLFKTMGLYNEFAIKFKYLTEIEDQARALMRLERNKEAIATSVFGQTSYENGELVRNPDNSSNAQLLETMVKSIIYQQRYISSESFDQVLGHVGKQGEKINEKLGFKLLPENLDGRTFSVNKAITQINNSYQIIALGWNILSATSNLFGGTSQGFINSGRYFTKQQYLNTELWVYSNKFNGENKKKIMAALEYFMPFTDNFNREFLNSLSVSKFTEQSMQDYLMGLMKYSDSAVQTVNFLSYLRNSILMDGKIVNAREYLRTLPEYADMYAGTLVERTARAQKFEKDAKELIEKHSVYDKSSVVDGKLVIPGIERKSESVIELRRKVQQFTSDALGNMSDENKRLINMSVYGKSMMVFKNWVPRLIDVRMGNLKYNSASDAYEWGRTRMIFKVFSEDLHRSLGSLLSALRGTDKGIDRLRKLYESKKAEYERDTGKTLEMTESEFIEMARTNIRNQAWDSAMYLAMFGLYIGIKALAPDDDEDKRIINQHKFLLKATDKLLDEIGYFYNPTNIFTVVASGLFPATSLIENYLKALDTFGKEMYGLAVQDEKLVESNHTIKYWMKSFPATSQASAILPLFWPELAKDLGIKPQSTFGIK